MTKLPSLTVLLSESQEKPSALKGEHPAYKKIKFINFFSIFVSHFCPPGSGSGYGSRDSDESGSNPDPIRIHNTDWNSLGKAEEGSGGGPRVHGHSVSVQADPQRQPLAAWARPNLRLSRLVHRYEQCSGSGIRCLFDPGIRNRFFSGSQISDPKPIFKRA